VEEVTHTLASITPTGNSNARYPFVSQTQTKHFELGNTGSPFRTITRTTAIDGYGTPYDVSTVSVENATGVNAGSTHTQRSFTPTANITNDISANWCLNRRTRIQDIRSHSLTNGGQLTRTVDQTWDLPKCRMTDQVVEPGSSWALSTHLDYDAFNNVWKKTTSGSNVTSRTTETFWGADGRYPVWTKNALAHQTFYGWNYVRGLKETETDPNGNVTVTGYDDLGRTVRVRRPDGTATRQAFTACNAGNGFCGDGLLRFFVQVSERDVSDQIVNYKSTYYDAANRPKYDHTLSFDGAVTVVRTNYNARGNVETQSVPYFAGAGAFAQTTYTYDLLNRLKKQERPTDDQGASLHTELTDYNGLTTTRTNAASGVRTEVSTAWGVMAQVTDEALKHTVYTHNAFGELRTVTDPLSNTTSVNYNVRGFKQNSTDPDMGFWEFTYDALGQMLTQTDAKTQITAFTYDVLGRMSSRTDHGSQLTTWNWDTAANGKGQLGSVTAPGGYSETHTYDNRSRRSSVTTVAAGSSYTVDYGYDAALGQLSTITYPTATSGRFSVQYAYQNGFLKDVRDTSSPTTPLWRTITQNARGNVTQEGFGNGQITNLGFDAANGNLESLQTGPSGGTATQNLVYDWYKVGNLENRKDLNQSLTENFQYDSLHRLKEVRRNSALTLSMTYDDIGNIVTKSDVGSYTYHPTRKHAVTSAGGNAYAYDANGNMTSRSGATVTWTTYNYPQTINQAGGNFSTFHYGPDRSRYRQVSQNGTLAEDRIYIGGVFEKLTVGSKTEFRHYIKANGKIVAIKLLSTVSTDNETFYLHDDHLGSTDVITRQSGAVYQRLSYDAWGNRRGSAWTGTPSTADKNAINASTHIGFTGQEQLDNLNLVHLNGRVYDPVLARFMSADPLVQSPYVSQSFNRYSYTWNNPLNATDPSGFCTGFLLKSFCEMYHPEQVTSALVLVNGIETMIVGPRDGMTGSAQMQTQADFQALKDSQQLLEQRQSQGSTVGGSSALRVAGQYLLGAIDSVLQDYYELQPLNPTAGIDVAAADLLGSYQSPFPAAATNADQFARDLGPTAAVVAGILTGRPTGVGAYRLVGGHHIHAKRAFQGIAGYDLREALAVSDGLLARYGVRHADITAAQQRLFRQLAASGAPNTLTQHSRIAYRALVEAGVPRSVAADLVIGSQSQLIRSGIFEPSAIPWGGQ
jgi:RHS repeat-associated protein